MKKIIILSLIITSLFVISCKNGSDSSSSSSTTTTTTNTPLQGTWANTTDGQTYVFNGTAVSVTQTGLPNLSTGASDVSMTVAGTFRLDSGNIYVTPTSIVVAVAGTPMSQADQNNYLSGNPLVLNTEVLWGAYAVNGNTLTITDPDTSTTSTYTKQ